MAKDYLDEILNDGEKALLARFADDDATVEVVRKVCLASIYRNGTLRPGEKSLPQVNAAFGFVANAEGKRSNEEIGADVRAAWEGVRALESALSNIAKYKTEEPRKPLLTNRGK